MADNAHPSEMFTKLLQIGVVTRDMDRFIENFRRLLGLEPKRDIVSPNEAMNQKDRQYYGEAGDFYARLVFYEFGNIQLEIIQPLSGKNIWQDFLDEKGEGIHHIRFTVDDMSKLESHFAEHGVAKMQNGFSVSNDPPNMQWAYFDTTRDLGFIIEAMNGFTKN